MFYNLRMGIPNVKCTGLRCILKGIKACTTVFFFLQQFEDLKTIRLSSL